MGRPRCDPFHIASVLAALGDGVPMLGLYRDYASTAARPYSRASFEALVKAAAGRRALPDAGLPVAGRALPDAGLPVAGRALPQHIRICAYDGAYWERFSPVKSRILTTTSDNASLKVKGSALIVTDTPLNLVYEKRAPKPQSIVMLGWSGYVSIPAMRFCTDYGIAIIILDWERDFMTVVAPLAKQSAALIRRQALANPLSIARLLIRAKIEAHLQLCAIAPHVAATAFDKLTNAASLEHILMSEAHAAKSAWTDRNITMQWREAGSIQQSWKLPYSVRRRLTGKTPKNATDPINALLNLVLAVTIGRLTVAIVARGMSPAIGFLHKSPRWSLSYDAIEPLRPHIEDAVFTFIDKHQFSPRDFIAVNGGSVKTSSELARAVIDAASVGYGRIDSIVDWLRSLLT